MYTIVSNGVYTIVYTVVYTIVYTAVYTVVYNIVYTGVYAVVYTGVYAGVRTPPMYAGVHIQRGVHRDAHTMHHHTHISFYWIIQYNLVPQNV